MLYEAVALLYAVCADSKVSVLVSTLWVISLAVHLNSDIMFIYCTMYLFHCAKYGRAVEVL